MILTGLCRQFIITILFLLLVVVVAPYIVHSAVYTYFWSFETSGNILRNQKIFIGSKQFFAIRMIWI